MRHIAVIGAGLAGAAVCARFAARGWQVTLIDAHRAPAQGASGNHAASFHPLIARDNNRMVRLIRAGINASLAHWYALSKAGFPFSWAQCGALQLARADAKQDVVQVLAGLDLDPALARAVDQGEASAIAGVDLRGGGVLFGQGGWVQPASLIAAQLASCGARLTTHYGLQVARAVRPAVRGSAGPGANASAEAGAVDEWTLFDASGELIAQAPVVVLASGADVLTPRLFGQHEWPVEAIAGQVSVVRVGGARGGGARGVGGNPGSAGAGGAEASTDWPAPQLPVHGAGYVLPCIEGQIVTGATYDRHGTQTIDAGHRHNFAQAARMFAAPLPLPLPAARLSARISLRAVARDRLPVIGALADAAALDAKTILRAGARLAHLPRMPGVYAAMAYGSRGLTWAALGAEALLAMVEGTPSPLEPDLIDAIDPGRFVLRAVRRAS